MTSVCPVVPLDLASPYATLLDPKTLAAVTRRAVSWADWIACNNPGAVITGSGWVVHPDDDDGSLTLSQEALVANVASVLITGGTDGLSYRLINTVTLDDGQVQPATVQITVREVTKQAALAA